MHKKLIIMIATTNKRLAGVLNDLIQINNDRVTGYEKAANEIKSVDYSLESKFHRLAQDSQRFSFQLSQRVRELGGEPASSTTASGKIYRVWMDVKGVFSGHDPKTVLENCEFGEDAAQRAYRLALETDADWDAETRQMIIEEQSALRASHDEIKALRDEHKKV
jgi:uncharacterized protein (TIGR02284 family)